jgi:integrase
MVSWSIFRRGARGGRKSKRHTVRVITSDGRVIERTKFADGMSAKVFAADLVREAERGEVGLAKPRGEQKLEEHVARFLAAQAVGAASNQRRRGKPDPAWVKRTKKRLEEITAGLEWRRLCDLDAGAAARWMSLQGWSDKTRDGRAALLRQFGSWLEAEGALPKNPFTKLQPQANEASATYQRAPLTLEGLASLMGAAEQRPLQRLARVKGDHVDEAIASGRERAVLYPFAAYSGLRRSEVLKVRWCDLHLEGDKPFLQVRAEIAKNRKHARIRLPAFVGAELQRFRDETAVELGHPVHERSEVFTRTSYRHLLERMQDDLLFAGLGERGPRGRVVNQAGLVLEFHSLRMTYASLLAEHGASPTVVRELMRHSDIRLSLQTYARTPDGAHDAVVDRLPAPPMGPPKTLRPLMAPSVGLPKANRMEA